MSICLLSVMVFMGSTSEPPEVSIGRLTSMDEGEAVEVTGVIADVWKTDSGSEILTLTDLTDNSSVRVIWVPGGSPGPAETLSIGDEARVRGELALAQMPPVLFVRGGDFWLVRSSEYVLSFETLSVHWSLFEGDTVSVIGSLRVDPATSSFRLCDPDTAHSLMLRWAGGDLASFLDESVLAKGVLRMDMRTLSLVLQAEEVSATV